VVLDSPDAGALTDFYRSLLGWEIEQDEPGWVKLRFCDGGPGLSFQTEPQYVPPVWPARPRDQQMQVHLTSASRTWQQQASAGAVLAEYQPQDDVRAYLDPAGLSFCLSLPG
jgi:catechol 2,3-dioxygenase-like lactoylglutathione lyase family enzyme